MSISKKSLDAGDKVNLATALSTAASDLGELNEKLLQVSIALSRYDQIVRVTINALRRNSNGRDSNNDIANELEYCLTKATEALSLNKRKPDNG